MTRRSRKAPAQASRPASGFVVRQFPCPEFCDGRHFWWVAFWRRQPILRYRNCKNAVFLFSLKP